MSDFKAKMHQIRFRTTAPATIECLPILSLLGKYPGIYFLELTRVLSFFIFTLPQSEKLFTFQLISDPHIIRSSAMASHLTSGSAMAEGPRDALVSRNSATYKTSHLKTRVSVLSCGIICRRTDRHTTTACTALSIASHGKNRL